jgi:hypothetical protein
MIVCKQCNFSCASITLYVNHMHLHASLKSFQCSISACQWEGRRYSSFKSHVSYEHKRVTTNDVSLSLLRQNTTGSVTCTIQRCQRVFCDMKAFMRHYSTHFNGRTMQPCPFFNCEKSFHLRVSFVSHVYYKHRHHSTLGVQHNNELLVSVDHRDTQDLDCINLDVSHNQNHQSEQTNVLNMLATASANFYLMLFSEHFIPANALQKVIECMASLHSQSNGILQKN